MEEARGEVCWKKCRRKFTSLIQPSLRLVKTSFTCIHIITSPIHVSSRLVKTSSDPTRMPTPTAEALAAFTDLFGEENHDMPVSGDSRPRPKHALLRKAEAQVAISAKDKVLKIFQEPAVRHIQVRSEAESSKRLNRSRKSLKMRSLLKTSLLQHHWPLPGAVPTIRTVTVTLLDYDFRHCVLALLISSTSLPLPINSQERVDCTVHQNFYSSRCQFNGVVASPLHFHCESLTSSLPFYHILSRRTFLKLLDSYSSQTFPLTNHPIKNWITV